MATFGGIFIQESFVPVVASVCVFLLGGEFSPNGDFLIFISKWGEFGVGFYFILLLVFQFPNFSIKN